MPSRKWHAGVALLGAGLLGQLGCADILGLLHRPIDDGGGGTGGSGANTGTSGAGGCKPESTEKCPYSGPAETKGIGVCQAAERTCNKAGTAWGPCIGEITPVPEDCATSFDDDCDGEINEADVGCACVPGDEQDCYAGPSGTAGVGICVAGTQTCAKDGLSYMACIGEALPEAEDPQAIGDEDCDGFSSSEADFAVAFGDGGQQRGLAVAVDPTTGDVYVAGEFNGSMTFDDDLLLSNGVADIGDIFVVKMDSTGKPIWAKQFGDPGGDQGVNGLAIDGDGGVLMTGYNRFGTIDFGGGELPGGIFISKLAAADGSHEWSRSCGNDYGTGVAIAADITGGAVVVTGAFGGTINCGMGDVNSSAYDDIFLLKLSAATGDQLWLKAFAGSSMEIAGGVTVDGSGNIFVAGSYPGSLDLQGDFFTASNSLDAFVSKRASNGAHLWSRSISATGDQVATDLAKTPTGGVVVVGNYQNSVTLAPGTTLTSAGGSDAFAVSYGAAGDVSWADGFGAASDQSATGVAVDAKGRVEVVGTFKGTMDFGWGAHTAATAADGFVVQTSSSGKAVWDRAFGGTIHNLRVAVGLDGEVFVVGTADGSLDFGVGPLSTNAMDLFIARLDP